jgi:hypothetical protein
MFHLIWEQKMHQGRLRVNTRLASVIDVIFHSSHISTKYVSGARSSGPNKPYKKPGLTYRPSQAEGVGLCGAA